MGIIEWARRKRVERLRREVKLAPLREKVMKSRKRIAAEKTIVERERLDLAERKAKIGFQRAKTRKLLTPPRPALPPATAGREFGFGGGLTGNLFGAPLPRARARPRKRVIRRKKVKRKRPRRVEYF